MNFVVFAYQAGQIPPQKTLFIIPPRMGRGEDGKDLDPDLSQAR